MEVRNVNFSEVLVEKRRMGQSESSSSSTSSFKFPRSGGGSASFALQRCESVGSMRDKRAPLTPRGTGKSPVFLSASDELSLLRRATKAWEQGNVGEIQSCETQIRVRLMDPAKEKRESLEQEVILLRQRLESNASEMARLKSTAAIQEAFDDAASESGSESSACDEGDFADDDLDTQNNDQCNSIDDMALTKKKGDVAMAPTNKKIDGFAAATPTQAVL